MKPISWTALLPPRERARALDAAAAIARDLPGLAADAAGTPPQADSVGVAAGKAGQALFYAYLELGRGGEGFGERGAELLAQALDQLGADAVSPDLYQGFTGTAWTVDHLQGRILDSSADEDLNADIDDALLYILRQSPWNRPYDLTRGLVGYAVYALGRPGRAAAVECLELIVDRLAELASEKPPGITWFTPRERLAEEAYEFFTGGNYNLGVAHGVAGVIAVLGRICRAGIATAKARPLLDGAVSWILAQRLDGRKALFPTAVGPGVEVGFSRAAWCYGDPGLAATLLVAARAVGEPSWEQEALEIARHSARRPFESTRVRDGCLCHGAAGLAHLFNRMHQATGDEILGQAARDWYRWLLDQRRPGQGIGGFINCVPTAAREMVWQAHPGFLIGAAGMGLALLAAATPVEPQWDELMLLSPIAPASGPP